MGKFLKNEKIHKHAAVALNHDSKIIVKATLWNVYRLVAYDTKNIIASMQAVNSSSTGLLQSCRAGISLHTTSNSGGSPTFVGSVDWKSHTLDVQELMRWKKKTMQSNGWSIVIFCQCAPAIIQHCQVPLPWKYRLFLASSWNLLINAFNHLLLTTDE